MNLGEIAQIKTGLVLSRKKAEIESQAKANYKLLTVKNLGAEGLISDESFETFVSSGDLENHYFTEEGDVLMRLSQPFSAVYIDKNHEGLLVPSYFAIIKVIHNKILPAYLAWYLNTLAVKKEIERSQAGSRIPSTNKQTLKAIPVVIPPLSKQNLLIDMYHLHQREMSLYRSLMEEKEVLFQGVAQKILGGKTYE